MALVLRYFHLDPKATTSSSSITTTLNLMNTSISNNTRTIEDKLNAITGKSLSSNDFTDYYKDKLRGIEEGAEVNVLADWDENDSTADSYIKNKPIIDTVVTENSNNLITSGAVYTAIDNLPEPMIFKGSLGTGGTILSLPSASSSNKGYTYKVITDNTYNGLTAKAGDVFISDGTTWVYIPSADEPNGTVTNVAVTVPTGLEVSGSPITTSGTLAITYAIGYAIPTLTDQAAWTAKQDAISDLSTIRSRADEGHTAYGWGNHANAGYLTGITSAMVTTALGYTPPTQDTNTTYSAGTGLSLSGTTFSLNLTKALVTTALGYTPPTTDTNTTYTIATGDSNGLIKVTPSSGNAYNVSVKGLGSRAYDSTSYLPLSGGTMTGDIVMGTNHYIYGVNETYGAMLSFDGTRTLIGSVGSSTSAATHLRSKTGHLTVGTDNAASYNVWDSGNSNLSTVSWNCSNLTASGNISLYSSSGDSPYLYFQRGTASDSYNDWRIYVPGGNLDFCMSSSGAWNTNPMLRLSTSPGTAYLNGNLIYTSGNVTVTNVTQNLSDSGNTDFRPILASGVTNTSSVTPTFSSGTGSVLSMARLYAQPSTGDLYLYNPDGGDSPYLYFQRGDFNTANTYDWRMYVQYGDFFLLNDAGGWHSAVSIDYDSNIHLQGNVITPKNDNMGIIPDTNNYGQIGSSSKYFYRSYINNMYGTVKGSFNGGNVTGNDASFYNYKCRNSTGFLIDSYGTFYFNSDGGSGDFNIYNNKNSSMVRAFYINSNNNATLAGTLTLNSDVRLKRIIEDCNVDVESIANAPLFKFRWKNRDDDNDYIGTSAQYWKELIPELVQESDDESNTLSLQYGTLGVVNSISIAKEVVELKEEIKLLQALIAELKLLLK